MTKHELLNLSDYRLNQVAKLVGTNWDRRRRIDSKTRYNMMRMFKRGKSFNYIANHYGYSYSAVRCVLDKDYKRTLNEKRKNYVNNFNPPSSYGKERIEYKKQLISNNKKLNICI